MTDDGKPMMPGREMFDAMLEAKGDTMDFHVDRDDERAGQTFSERAMNSIHDSMMQWIGSRVLRRWRSRPGAYIGPGPAHMRVRVIVTFDGEEPVTIPAADRPFYEVRDGAETEQAVRKPLD